MNKSTKRALDEASIRKMAGLYPVSSDFSITFTPDCYKEIDEKDRPKFTVKPYSIKEMRDMADRTDSLKGEELDNYANNMIRNKIVGMTNMINLSTQDIVPFDADEKGVMSREQFDTIPLVVKNDIMKVISEISSGIKQK
jgi:hypothetical protein